MGNVGWQVLAVRLYATAKARSTGCLAGASATSTRPTIANTTTRTQIMLDKYARIVTKKWSQHRGVFLQSVEWLWKRKLLPQPVTDRIQSVGA